MRYEAPTSVKQAVELLSAESGTSRVLAGGTDLLVQLRSGMIAPDLVVDLKRIEALQTIIATEAGWHIGAAVPSAAISAHAELVAAWPGVAEAMALVGSTQIQSRATLAGNLCNASPAADSVPAMIAANAKVTVVSANGQRDLSVMEVATGPGQTSLAKGEIVMSVLLPRRPARSSDAYLRFIPRTEMDIAVVGAGVNLTLDEGGTCTEAWVALGAVAPTARLVDEAGVALLDTQVDDAALQNLAKACEAACRPIDDKRGTVAFRTTVAGVLARRAAKIAYERAGSKS